MKAFLWMTSLVVAALLAAGATCLFMREAPIAEGVIHSVEFRRADGSSEGFTRANIPEAVPGRNGHWNVKASGKLYKDYLVIRYTDSKELGPDVVPTSRLVRIQFLAGEPMEVPK